MLFNLMVRIMRKLQLTWWQAAAEIILKGKGVSYGRGCRFIGIPLVERYPGSDITIGNRVVLCSKSIFTDLGVNHPVVLKTLTPGAKITIGDDCGLSGVSVCSAHSVAIGREVLMGANATIFDTDFHAINPVNRRYNNDRNEIAVAPVSIGNSVFIGVSAIAGKGVTLGDNSIIGAAGVVVKDVPPGAIACGNPAKVVGHV